jgi:dihydropteroate synthase
MASQGASWIDIGGESTRPGAEAVSLGEELDRVIPVIEAVAKETDVSISIDTSKAKVMQEAIKCGATMVNDVYALRKKDSLDVVSKSGVNVCLMHMHGEPRTMQTDYIYDDVTKDITKWLKDRVDACINAGIAKDRITIDPGFGFGKSDKQNIQLIHDLQEFANLGYPVLVGLSRKSSIGRIFSRELPERLAGSLALGMVAMQNGASILRVHDVKETIDVIKMHMVSRNVDLID